MHESFKVVKPEKNIRFQRLDRNLLMYKDHPYQPSE